MAEDASNRSRLVNVFGDSIVGHSATGIGVSAFPALQVYESALKTEETLTIKSILGTATTVRLAGHMTASNHAAVVPGVGGTSHIMS